MKNKHRVNACIKASLYTDKTSKFKLKTMLLVLQNLKYISYMDFEKRWRKSTFKASKFVRKILIKNDIKNWK